MVGPLTRLREMVGRLAHWRENHHGQISATREVFRRGLADRRGYLAAEQRRAAATRRSCGDSAENSAAACPLERADENEGEKEANCFLKQCTGACVAAAMTCVMGWAGYTVLHGPREQPTEKETDGSGQYVLRGTRE